MRQPDEFHTLTARALKYAETHRSVVTVAAGVIVALLLAGLALSSFRSTQLEQANTALARAMALYNEKKLPEATKAFDTMAESGNTPELFADVARIYSAQAALAQGEFARAAAGFSQASGGVDGFLQQRVLVNQAYALEGNQQFGDAASHFGQAAANGGPYTQIALMGQARIAERAGDAAKAKATYQKLLADFPDAVEKPLAEARLGALN